MHPFRTLRSGRVFPKQTATYQKCKLNGQIVCPRQMTCRFQNSARAPFGAMLGSIAAIMVIDWNPL